MRRRKVVISIVILLVIGLHVVPVLHAGLRKRMWPFLDWAMYKDAIPAGPIQATRKSIVGVTSKGQRIPVTDDTVGLSSSIDRLYIRPMRSGDSAAARHLIGRLNRWRDGDPFVEIRLESATYRHRQRHR